MMLWHVHCTAVYDKSDGTCISTVQDGQGWQTVICCSN